MVLVAVLIGCGTIRPTATPSTVHVVVADKDESSYSIEVGDVSIPMWTYTVTFRSDDGKTYDYDTNSSEYQKFTLGDRYIIMVSDNKIVGKPSPDQR